jgi:hypothetical protein
MQSWILKATWVGAVALGGAALVGFGKADAPLPTDRQLRMSLADVEHVGKGAEGRQDYRSARRALWALMGYTELRAWVPKSSVPMPTRAELSAAWTETERRVTTEEERRDLLQLRERYEAALELVSE